MMKVTNVTDILPAPAPKAEEKDFSDGFMQEMDKATNSGQAGKTERKDAPQDAKPADGAETPEADDVKNQESPDSEKTAQGEETVVPVILPSIVAVEKPVTETVPQQDPQYGSPKVVSETPEAAAPPPQTVQDQPGAAARAGEISPELPAEKPAAQAPPDSQAVSFAKQALKEANEMLEKGSREKQDTAPKSLSVEPAEPKIQPMKEMAAGMQEDSEPSGKESGKQSGVKQPAMTAPIQGDGKVEFKLAANGTENLEPVQQKAEILPRVIEQVRNTVSKEKTEFFLQLKPEHLGGLSILLSAEEKGVAAKLMTSSHDVQQVLQSDLNQLQAALREKGINVVHMEVIYDQTANSMAHDSGNRGQQHSGAFAGAHSGTGESVEEAAAFYDSLSYYDVLAEQGGSVEFSA